jgi:quercetin dioxygenase-like cupin family protein
MYLRSSPTGYIQALPGIQRKTLVYGEKSLLTEFHLSGGSLLPSHSHPQEQTGYLVSGHMRLTIAGETFDIQPGDSWCVPGSVVHQAEILLDSIAIETFSPIREDYLP